MKKNRVKEFFINIPRLCGFEYEKECSEVLRLAYEDELKNKKSLFRRTKNYMNNGDRFNGLYSFKCKDPDKLDYCINLLHIIEYKKYSKKDKRYKVKLEEYIREAEDKEKYYTDVSNYMTVKEAQQDEPFWF